MILHIYAFHVDTIPELRRLQRAEDDANPNMKIRKLVETLEAQFREESDSKVIIFVQMRVVAQYLAKLIQNLGLPALRAVEFTSTGPSVEEGGGSRLSTCRFSISQFW